MEENKTRMRTDLYEGHDHYNVDDLLTDEQKMIRQSVRDYVKSTLSPVIEDCAQNNTMPNDLMKQLGELGCLGPTVLLNMVVWD